MGIPGFLFPPEVTHSMGHYLMAVRDQLKDSGYARVTDIATRLGISRSSASVALASLRDKEYLTEDKNHFFQLTEKGENLAKQIYGNHLLLETFFRQILKVNEETALVDACNIEHLLSRETSQKLLCFVRFFVDREDELKNLLTRMRSYRDKCARKEECALCKDEGECPFCE
jgi:Mn-dependent DtxR family transcriptional regulator